MTYLICLYSATGQVIGDEEMDFEDDQAAIDHAREFLWSWAYEIWREARLVTESWPAQVARPAKAA